MEIKINSLLMCHSEIGDQMATQVIKRSPKSQNDLIRKIQKVIAIQQLFGQCETE